MRNILTIAKRELLSFFVSPIAYIIICFFLIAAAIFFVSGTISSYTTDMQGFFSNLAILVFMLCPIMAMKLLSEERKNGTIELLLTSPITSLQIVLGKYLAVVSLYFIILILTLIFPLFLEIEESVSWPMLFCQYTGAALIGMVILGLGLVFSAITENQIIAAIVGVVVSLGLYLVSWFAESASGITKIVIDEITILSHYSSFVVGVFDLKDISYFLIWIVFSIFLANKIIDSNRWRR